VWAREKAREREGERHTERESERARDRGKKRKNERERERERESHVALFLSGDETICRRKGELGKMESAGGRDLLWTIRGI